MDPGGVPAPETGAQCDNNWSDDDDTRVNDGCPAVGDPETGDQCLYNVDDDGDGKINDGCPADSPESGSQCYNATDDDGDGRVNDGCPKVGAAETYAACTNAIDDDGDGRVNDGCPYKESSTLDTIVVTRWVNGVADSHSAGAPIRDHIMKTDVWVRNVPANHPYGLGAFELRLSFDPNQLEYLQMTLDLTWVQSTGRTAWCTGPTSDSGLVVASCSTTGNPGEPWPLGPTGSGRVATVWFRVKDPDSLISRNVNLAGSKILDISAAIISASLQNGYVKTVQCPDANLDGIVNALDRTFVLLHMNDRGQNSGATLASAIDTTQTTLEVSALGSLDVGQVIAVRNEHMQVNAVSAGPPATIQVTRGLYGSGTIRTHAAGTPIYIATVDGNYDGKKAYTDPRDIDDNGRLDALDGIPILGVLNTSCPN